MTYRKKPSTSDPEIAEPDVFLKPGKIISGVGSILIRDNASQWWSGMEEKQPCKELLDTSNPPQSEHAEQEVRETEFVFSSEQVPNCLIWYGWCHIHQKPCWQVPSQPTSLTLSSLLYLIRPNLAKEYKDG